MLLGMIYIYIHTVIEYICISLGKLNPRLRLGVLAKVGSHARVWARTFLVLIRVDQGHLCPVSVAEVKTKLNRKSTTRKKPQEHVVVL